METFKQIAVLEDEVQAELVDSLLSEADIPHIMKSYHDTALDGIFQGDKYWGHVEAAAEHEAAILEIIKGIKAKSPDTAD